MKHVLQLLAINYPACEKMPPHIISDMTLYKLYIISSGESKDNKINILQLWPVWHTGM